MSLAFDASSVFSQAIEDHLAVIDSLRDQQSVLQGIAEEMTRAILAGKKILWCGNGGSAADSQPLAAELTGRFRRDRCALASIALTTDTSILTAVGNDYGYERIFQRQVEALCTKGDVRVCLSTSGASQNVCAALQTARQIGAFTVAFTGQGGGEIAAIAQVALRIPSQDTARIQQVCSADI
jgi:D-sedoheptulose 7-phosphate isomerase